MVLELRDNLRRYGMRDALRCLVLKILYQLVRMRCMIVFATEEIPPGYLNLDPRFKAGFVKAEQLFRFIGSPGWDDPEFGLTRERLIKAERLGKQWYAITDGENRLACLVWFSCVPTLNRAAVFFNSEWVYAGGGFTHSDYRGLRLMWVAHALAGVEFKRQGKRGLVGDVDGRNLPMLRGTYRFGFRPFGFGCFFEGPEKELIVSSPGCHRYGFRYSQPTELSNAKLVRDTTVAERTT